MMERILKCTLAYTESKKEKKKRYELFMGKKLTKAEIKAFLGALILWGYTKLGTIIKHGV